MNDAQRASMSKHRSLAELAARQLGLVTHAQAVETGMSPSAVGRRVKSGEWVRVLPNVYRFAAVPPNGRQAALAATLWAGPGSVVSHASAGVLWGIDAVRTTRVELWVPRRLRSKLVRVHQGELANRDRRVLNGIPIASVARTVIDLAGVLDDESLDAAVDDVHHRRRTTFGVLRDRVKEASGERRPGAQRLHKLLDELGDGRAAQSRLETRVRRLLQGAGLRPVRQYDVTLAGRRYRLDFAWPALRVAVETDGYGAHGNRVAFEADRQRWAELAAASWRIVPVTWVQATRDPAAFLEHVRATLAAAARALPATA